MKRIEFGTITVTLDGVEIETSTVLCLTKQEERLIGSSLEKLGFRRLNREHFLKVLAEQSNGNPLLINDVSV